MNIFSRRKNDSLNILQEDTLIIPDYDTWHGDKTNVLTLDVPLDDVRHDEIEHVPSHSPSFCWAFMGAVGGAGTTTLAVQMAYELAKQQSTTHKKFRHISEPKVCLIDLDFEAGSCMHHLDVEPGLSTEDLTGDISRIDTTLVDSLMSRHNSGISVLAAPNSLGANARVKPEVVLALLDAACEMFPYVILDIPQHWQSWSRAAIGGSDFVGLVSDLTIPALHMARTKRTHLMEMFKSETACQVILNKYERRAFNNSLRLSDARMALQCEIFGTLCADVNIIKDALNCGQPVGAIRTESRYAKDSRKLLKQIATSTKSNTLNEGAASHVAA